MRGRRMADGRAPALLRPGPHPRRPKRRSPAHVLVVLATARRAAHLRLRHVCRRRAGLARRPRARQQHARQRPRRAGRRAGAHGPRLAARAGEDGRQGRTAALCVPSYAAGEHSARSTEIATPETSLACLSHAWCRRVQRKEHLDGTRVARARSRHRLRASCLLRPHLLISLPPLVLQSLGLVLLVQSILVLQPTSTPAAKATALNLHQVSLPVADARSASLTTRTAPQSLSRAAALHCGSLDHVAFARAERRPLHQVRIAEQQGRGSS